MAIVYLCRECGEQIPQDQIDNDLVLSCPAHPSAIIDSAIIDSVRCEEEE